MAEQRRPPADRREALKARHRRAIIDAAAELMTEIGGTDFTVDQLAARADVSRRTVFNHFKTVDDITLEVFREMLGVVLDNVDANLGAADGRTSMFDRVAAALRVTDLVTPITELTRIFHDEDEDGRPTQILDLGYRALDPRQAVLFERAITDLGTRIAATTLRHHPSADPLEVDLMCGALVGGALAVVRHWASTTGGVDSPESRRVWDTLLDRMIATYRDGFGALGSDAS
ncbi:TetR/AcrR family transcriptional regulator [Nocardiopsis sp. MG754419]|uniref:TetR/AcrR family transcriptional regulator n=1 Tax=Nocardiopsis sp. MG754419 TaxID=2259865 RepID=UPI001BA50991|nr:TetR/AcrR family transcriptional regulator [Nocardiopsis sp. MG754419]MBR8743051.1 TetR/AcrR family transcriptional regulator [Nocardiopsis sp. MG754419]